MIVVHIDGSESELKAALEQYLRDAGYIVDNAMDRDGICLFKLSRAESAPTQADEPAPADPAPPIEMEIALGSAGIGGDSSDIPTVDPIPEPTIDASAEPTPEPPAPISGGELVIPSFTSACKIPFSRDPNCQTSELSVQNLETRGDAVAFTYCGGEYVHPVHREFSGMAVSNTPPTFTDTSIRVLVLVDGEVDLRPVLFKLVSGESTSAVFGADLQ